jgi:hypothetical protein
VEKGQEYAALEHLGSTEPQEKSQQEKFKNFLPPFPNLQQNVSPVSWHVKVSRWTPGLNFIQSPFYTVPRMFFLFTKKSEILVFVSILCPLGLGTFRIPGSVIIFRNDQYSQSVLSTKYSIWIIIPVVVLVCIHVNIWYVICF